MLKHDRKNDARTSHFIPRANLHGVTNQRPQPTWEVWYPGEPFSRQDHAVWFLFVARLKFGTRRRANLEVWYPQKPPGQIATRRFSEAGEPNRQSWQKSGYQISGSAKIRGPNHLGGTKSPVLGRGVPNAQSWRGGHQIPAPEEGRLIAIFKITRFYKQKNETFRYKITKICWRRRCIIAARGRLWRYRLWRKRRP